MIQSNVGLYISFTLASLSQSNEIKTKVSLAEALAALSDNKLISNTGKSDHVWVLFSFSDRKIVLFGQGIYSGFFNKSSLYYRKLVLFEQLFWKSFIWTCLKL